MLAKRLLLLWVSLSLAASISAAQVNELSVTVGRAFVSTQTIANPTLLPAAIHFGNEEAFDIGYGRLLKTRGIFGFTGEVPLTIYPSMDLSTPSHGIPKAIGALFATPSARINFFSGQGLSPWVSVGVGYARFRQSSSLNFYGSNPGPTGTNTWAMQFGGGLDVWPWRHWGIRTEVRDFYSGVPNLNIFKTTNSRQHNYYVGVGVIRRF
jgi:opacity protein-like surface antigen